MCVVEPPLICESEKLGFLWNGSVFYLLFLGALVGALAGSEVLAFFADFLSSDGHVIILKNWRRGAFRTPLIRIPPIKSKRIPPIRCFKHRSHHAKTKIPKTVQIFSSILERFHRVHTSCADSLTSSITAVTSWGIVDFLATIKKNLKNKTKIRSVYRI